MKSDRVPSVLLLEDEALIAYDLADHLRDAGFGIAGVLSSCTEALTWLQAGSADVVVLDIELRDGICEDVVRLLRAQRIPFVVHSGNAHDPAVHDEAFLDGIRVPKPCAPADLVAAVAASLAKVAAPGRWENRTIRASSGRPAHPSVGIRPQGRA